MLSIDHSLAGPGERRSLSHEISAVLVIKVLLLTILWFFLFRGSSPQQTPAAHFMLETAAADASALDSNPAQDF